MTDSEAQAQAIVIYNALVQVEKYYGSGVRIANLHEALRAGFVMLKVDHPTMETPFDGDPKPPAK